MAANSFSTDALVPNWAEASTILKGDLLGHPFRGNQYAEGHGAVASAIRSNPNANWAAKAAATKIEQQPEKPLEQHKAELQAERDELSAELKANPYNRFGGMDYADRKMAAEGINGRNLAIRAIIDHLGDKAAEAENTRANDEAEAKWGARAEAGPNANDWGPPIRSQDNPFRPL